MNFSYSEEQLAIQELAGQIIGDLITPERLLQLDKDADWMDRDLWKSLAEANLLGVCIPEEFGGADFGLQELCILLEQQGRFVAPSPLLCTLVYAGLTINEFGSQDQRERWLTRIAAGEAVLTAALYEFGSSDPRRPQATATAEGDSWRLDGEKACVPFAHLADCILVPARTGDSTVGIFLVDPSAKGVTLERVETTNHEPQCTLTLSSVEIAAADVIGDPKTGSQILDFLIERGLLALSAIQLGVCEAALHQTAEYTSTRKQFGKPIGSFQGVSMRAADGYIDVQAMRSTLWQAAWRLSEGLPARREVLAAKWWACSGGHRVVHTAQHLHGGTGSDVEYPIHRHFLWAVQNALVLGGAGHQLAELGAELATGELR